MAELKVLRRRGRVARTVERRDEILREASAALRQRRRGVLRMQHVAERLGLVKGNIYYYFKDRQELIYHCHLRCIEMSLEALEEAIATKASAENRLRQLLVRHIEIILGSDYGGAMLADMDELSPVQRRRYVAMRDKFEAGLRKIVAEGVANGEFPKTNIPLAGFAILGSINWMPKWHRGDGALPLNMISNWFAEFFISALKRRRPGPSSVESKR